MMIRAFALSILLACLPLAAAAQSTVRDRIVTMLQEDGYREVRISSTWLGRLRFLGSKPGARREIVINSANGVILRDYVRRTGGSSGDDDDWDDDDFDDDDYDDDDHDDDDDDDDDDDRSSGSESDDDD